MIELIRIAIEEDGHVNIAFHLWAALCFLLLALAVWIGYRTFLKKGFGEFVVDEVSLGIGDHIVRLKPNQEDLQIAYKMWVELKTRKIGLPIDEEHDVVTDLYRSWYEFFGIARTLIKEIPASKFRSNESTRNVVGLSMKVLNIGLRPHLTKWQARYRSWIEHATVKDPDGAVTPQELQQKYPSYRELLEDMRTVNKRLVYYTALLEDIVHGRDRPETEYRDEV